MTKLINGQIVIECGGLGAHDNWERNAKKAKREGLEPCAHCAQGMLEDTGWLIRWEYKLDVILPFDSEGGEIRRVGSRCVRHFVVDGLKDSHFRKVGA